MANRHGDFIWYELMTRDGDAASRFYADVIGWRIDPQGTAPAAGAMDYRMIHATEGLVGGVAQLTPPMVAAGARPAWLGYVAVDDVDAMLISVARGGGAILMPATDLDGVGRIAMIADPAGAPLYIMKPAPPADQPDAVSIAFSGDRPRIGHGAWNELTTPEPAAALHFYGTRFGWVKDGEMNMGPMGAYEFLRHGPMIGAVMCGPVQWRHYVRVADIDVAVARIDAGGGTVTEGPHPVPGGDFSLHAIDPEGTPFALVGSRNSNEGD